mgnify:FL=1|tara:strand:+ start:835 stop:1860 length:1026 start_codon:yes stop_codon:yes gene_type:complete
MADFNINHITGKQGQQGTVLAGVTTVSSTGSMRIPSGPTEQRGGRGRGVLLAGSTPSLIKSCDFITIATTGNSESFGDLSTAVAVSGACASATRSFSFGGDTSPSGGTNTTKIEYVVTSSKGGGNDFGDLTVARRYPGGVSDSTRGMANGGTSPTPGVNSNIIDYFTMASTGDASDFGDLILQLTYTNGNNCSSPTRGILAGGHPQLTPLIQFYNIQSKGDATKFGELDVGRSAISSGSNTTRGIIAGGATPSGTNTIDYITMSTEGNAQDFGDLLSATLLYGGAGMYSATRGVHAGGYPAINVLQFITIMSAGNATDFGDLSANNQDSANSSDSHGGLGE